MICITHPGGSANIDIHKVEVLGAASVVQKASATVPDQKHPEKYMNFDSDTLEEVVNNNLWYKDTAVIKLHAMGRRGKLEDISLCKVESIDVNKNSVQ